EQLSRDDLRAARIVTRIFLTVDVRADRSQKRLALAGDTAADAENFRLENIDDVRDSAADVADKTGYDFRGELVSGAHGDVGRPGVDLADVAVDQFPHHVVRMLPHRRTGIFGQGTGRGILLPATVASAHARASVFHNDHVAQLCAGRIVARKNLA